VDGFSERQPFTGDVRPTSERRGAHASVSNWVTPWARTTMRGGVERWKDADTFGMLGAGLRLLTFDERIDGRVELTGWKAARSFGTIEASATMRSSIERRGHVLVGRFGVGVASEQTPADIWFAGDTGRARSVLLRAHPLITEGAIRIEQIGRNIFHSSGEAQQWWQGKAGVRAGAAAFVDAVSVDRRAESRARIDVDVGIGARLAVPGVIGVLRIDVAKGVRDGATALSFVYDP
jgi:hypothetical protein